MEFRKEIVHRITSLETEVQRYERRMETIMENYSIEEPAAEYAIYSLSEKIVSLNDEIAELKQIFWNLGRVGFSK